MISSNPSGCGVFDFKNSTYPKATAASTSNCAALSFHVILFFFCLRATSGQAIRASVITAEIIKSEITELDLKLSAMEPLRKRRDALKNLLETYGNDETQPRLLDAPSLAPSERYKSLGTTQAMMEFLRDSPGAYFSPRDIGKAMLAGGHESKSPNFFNIVYTICKRKGEAGDFEVAERKGKKVFRLPSQPAATTSAQPQEGR